MARHGMGDWDGDWVRNVWMPAMAAEMAGILRDADAIRAKYSDIAGDPRTLSAYVEYNRFLTTEFDSNGGGNAANGLKARQIAFTNQLAAWASDLARIRVEQAAAARSALVDALYRGINDAKDVLPVGTDGAAARKAIDDEAARLKGIIDSSDPVAVVKLAKDQTPFFARLNALIADAKAALAAASVVTMTPGSYKGIAYTITRKGGVPQSVGIDSAAPVLAGKTFALERDAQSAIDQALADKASSDQSAALNAEAAANAWSGAEQDAYAAANPDFGTSPFASQASGAVKHWIVDGKRRKTGPQLVDQATLDDLKAQAQSLVGTGPAASAARALVQSEINNAQGQIDSRARASFSFLRSKISDLRKALDLDAQTTAVTTRTGSYRGIVYTVTLKGGTETGTSIQVDAAWKGGTDWPTEAQAKAAIDAELDARNLSAAKAAQIAQIRRDLETLKSQAAGVVGGDLVRAARATFDADAAAAAASLDQSQAVDLTVVKQGYANLVDAARKESEGAGAEAARKQALNDKRAGIVEALGQAQAMIQSVPATQGPHPDGAVEGSRQAVESARALAASEVQAVQSKLDADPSATPSPNTASGYASSLVGKFQAYQGMLTAYATAQKGEEALASQQSAGWESSVRDKGRELEQLIGQATSVPPGDKGVSDARAAFTAEAAAVTDSLAQANRSSAAGTSMSRVRDLLKSLQSAYQDYLAAKGQADAASASIRSIIDAKSNEVSSLVTKAQQIPQGDDAVESARRLFATEAGTVSGTLAAGKDAPLDGVRNFYQELVRTDQVYQAKLAQAQNDASTQSQVAAARIKAADDAARAAKAARIQVLSEKVGTMINIASSIPPGDAAVEQARAEFSKEAASIKTQLASGTIVDTGFLESRLIAMRGGKSGFFDWLLSLLGIR